MEEKERFEWDKLEGCEWIRDTEMVNQPLYYDLETVASLLNQQDKRIAELEEQLEEKEKEIAYLTKQVKKFNNEAQKYFEDAYCNDFHNQDKISFAIEQLDNFLKIIHSHEKIYLSLNDFKIINEIFEQQIKQLKGED